MRPVIYFVSLLVRNKAIKKILLFLLSNRFGELIVLWYKKKMTAPLESISKKANLSAGGFLVYQRMLLIKEKKRA